MRSGAQLRIRAAAGGANAAHNRDEKRASVFQIRVHALASQLFQYYFQSTIF